MTAPVWYSKAKRVPSPHSNPLAHNRPLRKAVFHWSEGGGTAEWLAHYVIGKAGEYSFIIDQSGHVVQLYPADTGARAMLNGGIDGGVGCNRAGQRMVQVCVVGYTAHARETLHKPEVRKALVELAAWLEKEHGIPAKHVGNGSRSVDNWLHKDGWQSHREAPGNDHTDDPIDWSWLDEVKDHHAPHRRAPVKKAAAAPHKDEHGVGSDKFRDTHCVVQVIKGDKKFRVRRKEGGGWTIDPKQANKEHPHGYISLENVPAAVAWATHKGHQNVRVLRPKAPEKHHENEHKGGNLTKNPSAIWPDDKVLLDKLRAVSKELGKEVRIVSGLRLTGHPGDLGRNVQPRTQWYFWEGWSRRLPGFNLAARPGTSQHEQRGPGRGAADTDVVTSSGGLVSIGNYPGGYAACRKHGLHFTASGEAWHVSPSGPDRWHP